jgi:hypothetical protein
MANVKKSNPVYQQIEGAIRRNPTISNIDLSQIEFAVGGSTAVVYASQIRHDLGIVWDASTKTFKAPEELTRPARRTRRTAVAEEAVVAAKVEAPAAVISSPVTPAGKIKALLEAAQQGYTEAEARRTALLAEVAAADAVVNDHLRRIDELTMTSNLPENVWKVISEISR